MIKPVYMMAALLSVILVTSDARAGATQTSETTSRQQLTSTAPISLTATDRARATQWHLSMHEWRRYKWLMRGIRGALSPHISPIEALGIAARTPEKRQHYARLWARMMAHDTAHVLAFQRAYTSAWHTLYPNLKAIGIGGASAPGSLKAGDRLLFFTQDHCPTCDRRLSRLLTMIKARQDIGLDIYLADAPNDTRVRVWARHHDIPVAAVKRGVITLNHDTGTLKHLVGRAQYPTVLRRHSQSVTAYSVSSK